MGEIAQARVRLGLALLFTASCGAFAASSDDEPPVAPVPAEGGADATVEAADAEALPDATWDGPLQAPSDSGVDARDAFVPPVCYVTDAGGPLTGIRIDPKMPSASGTTEYDVTSAHGYTNVSFRVCLSDGTMAPIVNGAISGSYVWTYFTNAGSLQPGFAQAQFYGALGAGQAITPRATVDFTILP